MMNLPGTRIFVAPGESIEAALRRFRKATEKAGLAESIARKQFHEKPSVRRRHKAAKARRRAAKAAGGGAKWMG